MTDAPAEPVRRAKCRCGALTADCTGEPVRISVCHCLECQKRTGGAFSAQARFEAARVQVRGVSKLWERTGDDGGRITYRFCPNCGSTVVYEHDLAPGVLAVPLGAFADPAAFGPPTRAVYEERRFAWVELPVEGMERVW